MKSLSYILFLWILCSGCASFKDVEGTGRDYIDQENMQRLVGRYESMPVTIEGAEHFNESIGVGSSIYSYQNFLFDRFSLAPTKNYAESPTEFLVEIEPIDKNKIILRLLRGSETIKTKKIRGRYREGYFYRRSQIVVFPFVPILFGYRIQRQRIGLEENMLVVDLRENRWAFLLIAGQYENSQLRAKYQKIIEQEKNNKGTTTTEQSKDCHACSLSGLSFPLR